MSTANPHKGHGARTDPDCGCRTTKARAACAKAGCGFCKASGPPMPAEAKAAIALCKVLIEKCADLPERAEDFGNSVTEKAESVMAWVDEHRHVTPAQMGMLENMERGVDKWLGH